MNILIFNKIDFKARAIIKYKEVHFVMIKRPTQQNSKILFNLCALNNTLSKYIKPKLTELKGKGDKYTTMLGNFHIPF